MNELSRNTHMEAERSSHRPSKPSHRIVCVHHSAVVILNMHISVIVFFLSGRPPLCVLVSSVCHVAETKHTVHVSLTVVTVTTFFILVQSELYKSIHSCHHSHDKMVAISGNPLYLFSVVKFDLFCSSEGKWNLPPSRSKWCQVRWGRISWPMDTHTHYPRFEYVCVCVYVYTCFFARNFSCFPLHIFLFLLFFPTFWFYIHDTYYS